MKVSQDQPVSDQDVADSVERLMRCYLRVARMNFELAFHEFQQLDFDPSVMQELWHRFNATERRLMKDAEEGKEWSDG